MNRNGFLYFLARWSTACGGLLIAALLAGCGGGSASAGGAGGAVVPAAPVGITLSGSVVAGPVASATVQAFCHNTQPPAAIGSAVSNAQASYQLVTTSPCATVVELRVSDGSYTDEATGTTVTAPASTWMRALVDTGGGDKAYTAQITVLTELLYQQASANSSTTPTRANVSSTAGSLRTLLAQYTGTDLDIGTAMPSIVPGAVGNDSATAYSLLLAALSRLSGASADAVASTVSAVARSGFGRDSQLTDALRFVASSASVLQRLGTSQESAGKFVTRAESYVAVEALLPLSVVPDSSGLSCEPLEVLNNLSRLADAHKKQVADRLLSQLSVVLSQDSYVRALQAWKTRCGALSDTLAIFIPVEQAGGDKAFSSFIAHRKPLRDCATIQGVVVSSIVRGTGYDMCVVWDGASAPTAFALSSTQPAASDPAISYARCVQLSEESTPFTGQRAVFIMRGTSHLFCGVADGAFRGFNAWLDRQNIGYYPSKS